MTDAEAEAPDKVQWDKPKEWIGDTKCEDKWDFNDGLARLSV